ncbi:MAG: hypothetical protein CSA62_12180 [Planctomycetota bacterium]|nr:MAG: hypothetical protein CSA62_12180 [Planctomycetota bacterium]
MRQKLRNILHQYKIDAFKFSHDHENLDEIAAEALTYSDDALNNAYNYHFHKLPDASRAEIINMIQNYTVEALLPPVVEKIMQRIVILERQQDRMLKMVESIIEELDSDEA